MKLLCSMPTIAWLFFSCKHQSSYVSTNLADSAAFAYPVKNAGYWITDTSHTNIIIALKALKAFEKGDTVEMGKYSAHMHICTSAHLHIYTSAHQSLLISRSITL